MTTTVLVILAAFITLFLAWAYFTAQRLHRLHIRLDRSRDAFEAALDQRCAVIMALHPDLRDECRSVESLRLTPTEVEPRLRAEQDLRRRVGEQEGDASNDIDAADTRVAIALRFYNDAVSDVRSLRLRPVVRLLRLGGTAALPSFASLSL